MKARLVLLFMIALIAVTVYFWADTVDLVPADISILRDTGLLFGAVGLVFIFFQFVFVSRIKVIESGFGLDHMLRWHRLFGRVGLGFVTLHALMIFGHSLIAFGTFFTNLFIWLGLAGLLGFMITASLASFHRKLGLLYETWRNIHLANYILFPVALVHVFYFSNPGSLLYILWLILAVLFATVVIYRAARIAEVRSNPYEVVEVKQEAEDIWSLFFKGRRFNYKPGQFMFIQLLREGRLSSPHPFTISSPPTREHLSITPKELGDFTSTIKETRTGDLAFIDAPYGVFSFLNYNSSELVFIAGGVGITPFISMLRYIYDQQLDRKVTLFWANRGEKNLCFRDELAEMEREMPKFSMVPVMSNQPDWPGVKGRLSGKIILEHLGGLEDKTFYVCGPPAMSKAIIEQLKELKVPPQKIKSELFEL